jgi:hypothetical protein
MASQPPAGKNWWEMSPEEAGIDPWSSANTYRTDPNMASALQNMSPEQRARWSMEHLDRLDYRTPESSWQQWMAWQDSYDPSCPPSAPYKAEDGSGCVEKPDNSNAGYQGGQGGSGGGGGRGGGGRGGGQEAFSSNVPKFEYTPFQAPSYESAMADPGYQFSLKEGEKALQHSQAAQGLLRTGGSLRDILSYGQDRAAQQYGDVYNRALGTWGAQYQGQKDAFAPQYGAWQTQYAGDLSRWTTGQNAALQKYLQREQNIYGLLNPTLPQY